MKFVEETLVWILFIVCLYFAQWEYTNHKVMCENFWHVSVRRFTYALHTINFNLQIFLINIDYLIASVCEIFHFVTFALSLIFYLYEIICAACDFFSMNLFRKSIRRRWCCFLFLKIRFKNSDVYSINLKVKQNRERRERIVLIYIYFYSTF